MPSRTYSADVVANFIGKDKSLGRTTHETSREVSTMRDKFRLAGKTLTQFAKGDVKGAKRSFGELKTSMSGAALAGLAIGASVVAGIATAVAAVKRLIDKYIELGKQVGMVNRLAGTEGAEGNSLSVQWRMLGIDVDTAAKALGRFGANLGDAQKGGPKAAAFEQLGVNLKDANGEWRTNADILDEVRTKMAALVKGGNLAGYQNVAKALLGKGWMDLDKWLRAAPAKIAKFKRVAADSTVNWNDKSLTPLLEDTREIGIRWDDIKATVGQWLSGPLKDFLKVIKDEMPNLTRSAQEIATALAPLGYLFKKIALVETKMPWLKDAFGSIGLSSLILTNNMARIVDAFRFIRDLAIDIRDKIASISLPNLTGLLPNPLDLIPGLAAGGYVAPKIGGTIVRVAEAGEGEYVTPASKMGGQTIHVHIGTLAGTDERAARQFADMVGRHLMRGVSRGMVGQNA